MSGAMWVFLQFHYVQVITDNVESVEFTHYQHYQDHSVLNLNCCKHNVRTLRICDCKT